MKAFIWYNQDNPDEVIEIKKYLNQHGRINISDKELKRLYIVYCDEKYYASWVDVYDDNHNLNFYVLHKFARWLSEREI